MQYVIFTDASTLQIVLESHNGILDFLLIKLESSFYKKKLFFLKKVLDQVYLIRSARPAYFNALFIVPEVQKSSSCK